MHAAAAFTAGLAATAASDHELARLRLEDAVDRYEKSALPHEAAEARTALAEVLVAQPTAYPRKPPPRPLLSARDAEVLRLVGEGLGDREIATSPHLRHTVHRYVSNIFAKLGVSSRAAAVAEAAKRGIT